MPYNLYIGISQGGGILDGRANANKSCKVERVDCVQQVPNKI
jgi:hypothetical protein